MYLSIYLFIYFVYKVAIKETVVTFPFIVSATILVDHVDL